MKYKKGDILICNGDYSSSDYDGNVHTPDYIIFRKGSSYVVDHIYSPEVQDIPYIYLLADHIDIPYRFKAIKNNFKENYVGEWSDTSQDIRCKKLEKLNENRR